MEDYLIKCRFALSVVLTFLIIVILYFKPERSDLAFWPLIGFFAVIIFLVFLSALFSYMQARESKLIYQNNQNKIKIQELIDQNKQQETKIQGLNELINQKKQQETITRELIDILYDLADRKPMRKDSLLFLSRNLQHINRFPINKLGSFDLRSMFRVDSVNKKIIWEKEITEILIMFNYFYKNIKAENEGENFRAIEYASIEYSLEQVCSFVEIYKEYEPFKIFHDMLNEATPDIPSQWCPGQ